MCARILYRVMWRRCPDMRWEVVTVQASSVTLIQTNQCGTYVDYERRSGPHVWYIGGIRTKFTQLRQEASITPSLNRRCLDTYICPPPQITGIIYRSPWSCLLDHLSIRHLPCSRHFQLLLFKIIHGRWLGTIEVLRRCPLMECLV